MHSKFFFLTYGLYRHFLSLSKTSTECDRFNSSGTRLLCYEDDPKLVVYSIPSWQQPAGTGEVVLNAPDFHLEGVECEACCFAGSRNELVISASKNNNNLYFWSLPEECKNVNRSLRILSGHENTINCVRSSSDNFTLISCDKGGVIKLWTPNY